MEPSAKEMERVEKAFDKVYNFLLSVQGSLKKQSEIDMNGIDGFLKVMKATNNRVGLPRYRLCKEIVDIFMKLYENYRDEIVSEDLEWLMQDEVILAFGKSGKASIPLSLIYRSYKSNSNVSEIEGYLFNIFYLSCPEVDSEILAQICDCFVEESTSIVSVEKMRIGGRVRTEESKEMSSNDISSIVGTIVSKVSNSPELTNVDGANPNDVIPIVEKLFRDEEIQNAMNEIVGRISSGGELNLSELINSIALQAPRFQNV